MKIVRLHFFPFIIILLPLSIVYDILCLSFFLANSYAVSKFEKPLNGRQILLERNRVISVSAFSYRAEVDFYYPASQDSHRGCLVSIFLYSSILINRSLASIFLHHSRT